jgi:hypothetical protein
MMNISKLLKEMQRKRVHMALVIDEYGGVSGLVTMEDLLEEIVGEIRDEYDTESPVIQISEGVFLVDASISIRDLKEDHKIEIPESTEYETLSGFLLTTLQKIPKVGAVIEIESKKITVSEMVGQRISKIKLEKLPEEVEVQLSQLVAQASVQLLQQNMAQMQDKKNQQMQQDPLVQMQQAELQIKAQDAKTKELKVRGDLQLKAEELSLKARESAARTGEDPNMAAMRMQQEIMQAQELHALEVANQQQQQQVQAQQAQQQIGQNDQRHKMEMLQKMMQAKQQAQQPPGEG